eukprot:11583215-Ditylum_brightwellii.AAC.1
MSEFCVESSGTIATWNNISRQAPRPTEERTSMIKGPKTIGAVIAAKETKDGGRHRAKGNGKTRKRQHR